MTVGRLRGGDVTIATARKPCAHCHRMVPADRLILGLGRGCAAKAGIRVLRPRVRPGGQDGPDLLSAVEEDACDGWDRPADAPS